MAHRSRTDLAREIRETGVPEGAMALWWLGQSSIVAKAAGRVVGVDLYLTDYGAAEAGMRRAYAPLVRPDELDMMDVVLCTHEHIDHLDPQNPGRHRQGVTPGAVRRPAQLRGHGACGSRG